MIIYLCIKFQFNTPIFSKDIARKPFVLRKGRTGRDGRTYHLCYIRDRRDGTDVRTERSDTICPPLHWKCHNSQYNWWILLLIELDLYFMIIYLCLKFQSNAPIFSKDIARKPYVLRKGRTGRVGRSYGQRWYYMPPHWKWRGGHF